METSKPLPYEQSLPDSEKVENSDTLPPPIETVTERPTQQQATEQAGVLKEAEFVKQAIEKRPEVVLAHVEEAAKKGEAQEAVYELRHEIKDEAAQPMVPVGSVVAEIPERQPAIAKAEQYVPKSLGTVSGEPENLPQLDENPKTSVFKIYRRPMIAGFAVALAGLGIFVIYSLITK